MAIVFQIRSMLSCASSVRSNDNSKRLARASLRGRRVPAINVFRQGSDFVAIIEMPGVSKDDLSSEVRGNTIRIFGKKAVDYGGDFSMHRRERIAGTFDRTISLPVQLDPDRIMAGSRDRDSLSVAPKGRQ